MEYEKKFSDLGQITHNASELVRLSILEARWNLRESLEFYKIKRDDKEDALKEFFILRGRLGSLLFEIKPLLNRYIKDKKELQEIYQKSNSSNEKDLIEAIDLINFFLEKIGLTSIDRDYGEKNLVNK